ncbi:CidA/LrgA family protein [Albidovulum sp.]|uniref:CidA/LrgA family protein n=1 Tax=Albidovulum sp. TaxID=1872424 RepID=UPI0039B837B7
MIHALIAILLCQLAGEAGARLFSLPVPGPVIGMLLMLGLIVFAPRLAEVVRPTAEGILANLSLLFVPAGVGVVGHIATLGAQALSLLLAVVASTVLAIAAGAVTFALVARLTGTGDE